MTTKNKLVSFFARAFGAEDAQPSVAQVQAQIDQLHTEQDGLRLEEGALTHEIARYYGSNTEELSQQRQAVRDRIVEIDVVFGALQATLEVAEHRETLAQYDTVCANLVSAHTLEAQKKQEIDEHNAAIKRLQPDYRSAIAARQDVEQQFTWFSKGSAPRSLGAQGAPADLAAPRLTALERKEIEFKHGLINADELAGARRDAALTPYVLPDQYEGKLVFEPGAATAARH